MSDDTSKSVRHHNHGLDDLPIGTGPGKLVTWDNLPTGLGGMDVFTGTAALGTVVTAGGGAGSDLAYNAGLHDYEELTLSAGDTFAPSNPFTPLIIRAKTRITINGTIDVSGLIQQGDGFPFTGSSASSGGGGGGGGGGNPSPAESGQHEKGTSGYFYAGGSVDGTGGAGGFSGGNGAPGTIGTPGLSLDSFNPAILSYLRVFPGVLTVTMWGGLGGRRGGRGGGGGFGQTGGAAGGFAGQGAGAGGLGGGQIILIAPEIVFGPAAQLISNGTVGSPGNPGGVGANGAAGNDDGGGGGGGQGGGGGGCGGPIFVFYQTLTDAGVTTSVLGGAGAAGGAGALGGAAAGAGQAGGSGGAGPTGATGSPGLVVFSQVIPA